MKRFNQNFSLIPPKMKNLNSYWDKYCAGGKATWALPKRLDTVKGMEIGEQVAAETQSARVI